MSRVTTWSEAPALASLSGPILISVVCTEITACPALQSYALILDLAAIARYLVRQSTPTQARRSAAFSLSTLVRSICHINALQPAFKESATFASDENKMG